MLSTVMLNKNKHGKTISNLKAILSHSFDSQLMPLRLTRVCLLSCIYIYIHIYRMFYDNMVHFSEDDISVGLNEY